MYDREINNTNDKSDYMEKKSYEEYFSGLTPQQQKMLKQGLAYAKKNGR